MNVDEWGIPKAITPSYEEETITPKKKDNSFKIMYSAMDKKMKPTQKEKESISAFLFDNILANDEATLELALIFTTHNIPVDKQYDIVRAVTPKCYIPYPKKSKKNQLDLDNIIRYYDVNPRIAEQYYNMMTVEERKKINNKYKEGAK